MTEEPTGEIARKRRPRYPGKNPRRFEDRYKELAPEKYPETVAKVLAAGRTPAGSHIPILVSEVLGVLRPCAGEVCVDCTLGYGGHAKALLPSLLPGGHLLGLDVDPIELPRTELRLRSAGYGEDVFTVRRSNFAGLGGALRSAGFAGADCILADLGVSSMQIDSPGRGFSLKAEGPLDMRMNPERGISAGRFLAKISSSALESLLVENSDEPKARELGRALAGKEFATTSELGHAVRKELAGVETGEQDKSVRRVFQTLRIAVNEEFSALEALLRQLPDCLNPGGRVAILTFHSGEDRRVKKALQAGYRSGVYSEIARDVIRAGAVECRDNPRATSAKLRWAVRG